MVKHFHGQFGAFGFFALDADDMHIAMDADEMPIALDFVNMPIALDADNMLIGLDMPEACFEQLKDQRKVRLKYAKKGY